MSHVLAALHRPELPLATKRLLWTAAIVIGTSLPHWPTITGWMPLFLLAAIGWRFGVAFFAWPAPPRIARFALAMAALFSVLFQYRTLNGIEAGSAPEVTQIGRASKSKRTVQ